MFPAEKFRRNRENMVISVSNFCKSLRFMLFARLAYLWSMYNNYQKMSPQKGLQKPPKGIFANIKFRIPPTWNPGIRSLLAPQAPKLFFSMVIPHFLQLCPDGSWKVPKKSGIPEKSGHITLDLTIWSSPGLNVRFFLQSHFLEEIFKNDRDKVGGHVEAPY